MNVALLEKPQTIKVSSKRQITIPAKIYEKGNFGDYALATWTDRGLLIQPLELEGADETVDLLRMLIAEGYEGEGLVEQYKNRREKLTALKSKIEEAEDDIAAGRVGPFDELQENMREKYGLCN